MTDDHLDACLGLLSDSHRRRVVEQLRQDGRTTVDDLVDQLHGSELASGAHGGVEQDRLRIQLLHTHLPKLADHEVVEYDRRSGAVRYRPDEQVERVLDSLPEEVERVNV